MAGNASSLKAVLFDRDWTLVVDVPYNGDPRKVEPFPAAREVLDNVRSRGLATGVLSNQSGIARSKVSMRGWRSCWAPLTSGKSARMPQRTAAPAESRLPG